MSVGSKGNRMKRAGEGAETKDHLQDSNGLFFAKTFCSNDPVIRGSDPRDVPTSLRGRLSPFGRYRCL